MALQRTLTWPHSLAMVCSSSSSGSSSAVTSNENVRFTAEKLP
jgi:hypothetical protein